MLNVALWGLAGGIIGWITYSFMNFNENRGLMISVIIGTLGGFLGGNVLAPMFGAGATVNPGDFHPFRLVIAFASAAACLIIGNMLYKRFGI